MLQEKWVWHYEKSGEFNVRSTYKLLADTKRGRVDWLEGRPANSSTAASHNQWKKLRRASVPAKIKKNSLGGSLRTPSLLLKHLSEGTLGTRKHMTSAAKSVTHGDMLLLIARCPNHCGLRWMKN